ncbi:hypothetical protein D3C74_408950 [compost metagenome]
MSTDHICPRPDHLVRLKLVKYEGHRKQLLLMGQAYGLNLSVVADSVFLQSLSEQSVHQADRRIIIDSRKTSALDFRNIAGHFSGRIIRIQSKEHGSMPHQRHDFS